MVGTEKTGSECINKLLLHTSIVKELGKRVNMVNVASLGIAMVVLLVLRDFSW